MVRFKKYSWLFFFFIFNVFLFFPVLKQNVPVPLDLLTGAYYPWLDYKWGYSVGVPVKNPSLSDVISQLYVWRSFALDQIKTGSFPLWNPHSYLGMPLLANWQSAVMYPLNLALLVFGNLPGWTLLVYLQLFLSQVFMYLFLRILNLKKIPSVAGAIIFSLSGYMTTNLEYVTVGHTFLWLPLLLLIINRFMVHGRSKYLWYLPLVIYFQVTAGSIYSLVYSILICCSYTIYLKYFEKKGQIFLPVLYIFLGFCLSSIQIWPSVELVGNSIRFIDPNIIEHEFGLLPVNYLLTFLAPDIFGNPTTGNYYGYLGYQETTGYFGLSVLAILAASLPWLIKEQRNRLWLILAVVFTILSFDNPVSRQIYNFNLPIISSWYASRALLPLTFVISILFSSVVNRFGKLKIGSYSIISFLLFIILFATAYHSKSNLILLRNLVFPAFILAASVISVICFKNKKISLGLFLLVALADLSRFYYKFTPFSPSHLDYPTTPVIGYLKANTDNYRVEREKDSIFPPNSLVSFGLSTPSGYDPLAILNNAIFYDSFYNRHLNTSDKKETSITRYSELTSYSSPALDLYGVKYLTALKHDRFGQIRPRGEINRTLLTHPKYRQVFSDGATVVLENTQVLPRALIYTDFLVEPDRENTLERLASGFDFYHQALVDRQPNGISPQSGLPLAATINNYQANHVEITTKTEHPSLLVLTDTDYPGWIVTVDGQPSPILNAFGIFRAVAVPTGTHQVVFKYLPPSFMTGMGITVTTLAVLFYLFGQMSIKSKEI